MKLPARFAAFVNERKQQSLYRVRRTLESPQGPQVKIDGRVLDNFSSNDYLGLADHPDVIAAFQRGAREFGVGSGASHLVVGHSRPHQDLEDQLAAFVGYERALLFSSGYMANVGVINALLRRGDVLLQDKLNHASLIDAGQLSNAEMKRYAHGDVDALAARLANAAIVDPNIKLVATDAVFSMDGDIAPLKPMIQLCERHHAMLMIDDAHGFGVLGEQGKGSLEHCSVTPEQVPVYMATLGKALGVCGAFVAGEAALVDYLVQSSRNYIYTTALPPATAMASSTALKLLQSEHWRRAHLNQLIKQFRDGLSEWSDLLMPSVTAIQPVVVGDADIAVRLSQKLLQKGILVTAIRPPTVPQHTARLRITLTAAHSEEQVGRLLEVLNESLAHLLNRTQTANPSVTH